MIIGRIHDTVKLVGLTAKWEQKKQNIGKKQAELTPEERQIEHFREQMEDIREGNEYAQIGNKINSGAKLTPEEIEYLRRENPQALQNYEEIQKEKENYKRQLRSCKTKKDVEKLKQQKMGEFMAAAKKIDTSPYIPKEQKLAMFGKLLAKLKVVEEAHYEFTKSLAYQSLPTEEEKQQAEVAEREQKLPEVTAEEAEVSEQAMEMEQVIEPEQAEMSLQDNQSDETLADEADPVKTLAETTESVEADGTKPHDTKIEYEQAKVPQQKTNTQVSQTQQAQAPQNPQNIRRDIENMMRKYNASTKKVDVLA